MYILSWWHNGGVRTVVADLESLKFMIDMLEKHEIYYKVSRTLTPLTPRMLNMDGSQYWLYPGDLFNEERDKK